MNHTAEPDLPAIPAAGGAPELTREGVDPELATLGAPPRGRRYATMTIMAMVVAASLALIAVLQADVSYYFAPSQAVELGPATEIDPAALTANSFVTVSGTPMASGTVHYSRMLTDAQYAVFPLAGQRNVFVQVPVEDLARSRQMARREFSGRLVTFGQLGGRFSAVRGYLSQQMGMPVSSESFLLMADEAPSSYAWALLLCALALLFIVLDLFLLMRWFRPIERDADFDDLDDDPLVAA